MHTTWRIISSPFKWCWYFLHFIREFILNLLLIFLVIVIVGPYLQMRHMPPLMTGQGALILDLNGTVVDKPVINSKFRQLSQVLLGASHHRLQKNSLFNIVNMLRQAKNDTNITGIVLSLKNFSGADQASLEYIGKMLREFRDNGKPIYAVGDNYSQAQYFLASYANRIYLTPHGAVDLHGIAKNNLYYKSLFNKIGINSHIFRVGTYKSAVEPFIRDNMSENARKADNRWIGQLWKHYLITVADNRQVTPEQLFPGAQVILSRLRALKGDTAQFALKNKLVDEIQPLSLINSALIHEFGWNKHNKTFNGISIYDYQPVIPSQHGDQIFVIFVDGVITDGLESPGFIGGDAIAKQIYDARMDPNIKAIILRVNSPGGSVTASEVIRSELSAARASGKPIVVSMGGIAASGGYWISTPANYIIASANTLTGSIGIFGVVHTIESSLDSIGVHNDGVSTSPLADLSITKTLPVEFSQLMQLKVENGYQNFLNLVAQSRHKTTKEIDKIGQGHVWIGSDAVQNGLVDQLGDFDDAVKKATELAKLKQYQLNCYLGELGFLDFLFAQTSVLVYDWIPNVIQSWLPVPIIKLVDKLKIDTNLEFSCSDPQNYYAFCLSCDPFLY